MGHYLLDVIRSKSWEALLHTQGEEVDGIFLLCVPPACRKWLEDFTLEFFCVEEASYPQPVCPEDDGCCISLPAQLLLWQVLVNILDKRRTFFSKIDHFQVFEAIEVRQILVYLLCYRGCIFF